VRFDAVAGLQVGDTTLGQTGGLVMQGTPGSITLTANTGSPTPGFWRGIEVQNGLAVPAWTNVLIEWAGGARPLQTPTTESCVLIVNDQGQPLVMDSVKIRQCVHAGIHLFGGNLAVHRSRIDSVTGSGIHVDFQGRLQLDSTRIVGAGQEGLLVASPTAGLTTNEFNKFLGNGLASVRLYAPQLRGFKQQDSIAGNGFLPAGSATRSWSLRAWWTAAARVPHLRPDGALPRDGHAQDHPGSGDPDARSGHGVRSGGGAAVRRLHGGERGRGQLPGHDRQSRAAHQPPRHARMARAFPGTAEWCGHAHERPRRWRGLRPVGAGVRRQPGGGRGR
jgi:hypothetical protein